jgi:hypothetical protein
VYARLLTFTGSDLIDEAIAFLRVTTLPVLRRQKGFVGVSAGCDRAAKLVTILSVWTSEAALLASDAAMLETREAAMVRSGATMQVEHFEQVSEAFAKTPITHGALILTRLEVAPQAVESTMEFLEREVLIRLQDQPGFCSMRTLFDRRSGRGLTGLSWDGTKAMKAGSAILHENLVEASTLGLRFDESRPLELLLFEKG